MKQITTILVLAIFFSSCTKDQGAKNTLPTRLSVNIPDNLSTAAASRSVQNTNLMDGADTYEMIRAFVATAEGAAEVVESITTSLHEHNIKLFAYHDNLDAQIINLGAPAYFNEDGFIFAGASLPTGFTEDFVDMSDLSPYIPIDIKNLEIKFE